MDFFNLSSVPTARTCPIQTKRRPERTTSQCPEASELVRQRWRQPSRSPEVAQSPCAWPTCQASANSSASMMPSRFNSQLETASLWAPRCVGRSKDLPRRLLREGRIQLSQGPPELNFRNLSVAIRVQGLKSVHPLRMHLVDRLTTHLSKPLKPIQVKTPTSTHSRSSWSNCRPSPPLVPHAKRSNLGTILRST